MDLVPAYTFLGVDSAIRCVHFASRRSKEYMIAGSCGGDLSIWKIESKRILYIKKAAHSEMILGLTVAYTGDEEKEEKEDTIFMTIASHAKDGYIALWDVSVHGLWIKKCLFYFAL